MRDLNKSFEGELFFVVDYFRYNIIKARTFVCNANNLKVAWLRESHTVITQILAHSKEKSKVYFQLFFVLQKNANK